MATPSSSTTSPSPPMTYLTQVQQQNPEQSGSVDSSEREQRKKAVQKFLARAEVSMVTRALRTRLSYASYKAKHNMEHASLPDLETQIRDQPQPSPSRTIAAKRKPGGNNHYNNPATQGNSAMSNSLAPRRPGPGSTALPGPSSRPQYAGAPEAVPSRPSESLFTSILAIPPSHMARTIFNAHDPPVAAPSRPPPSPQGNHARLARSIAEGTRAHARSRRGDNTPGNSKSKSSGKGGQKRKRASKNDDLEADGYSEQKAAAALTSLLMQHRPSVSASATSPRSSVDGSDNASVHSHFAQSSARLAGSPLMASSTATSTATLVDSSSHRGGTPPPSQGSAGAQTTPRPAPTDNEAADLMLFLATSPSPARPSNKDARDAAAFRQLGGQGSTGLRGKGRVLFPTATEETLVGSPQLKPSPMTLTRGGTAEQSFASSISSIGGEMQGLQRHDTMPDIASTRPSSQLLYPPPSAGFQPPSPSPSYQHAYHAPPEFNYNEFIHASPVSPRRGSTGAIGAPPKSSSAGSSLRADVGRKLFEEEQMRMGAPKHLGGGAPGQLGAGIDLIHG